MTEGSVAKQAMEMVDGSQGGGVGWQGHEDFLYWNILGSIFFVQSVLDLRGLRSIASWKWIEAPDEGGGIYEKSVTKM